MKITRRQTLAALATVPAAAAGVGLAAAQRSRASAAAAPADSASNEPLPKGRPVFPPDDAWNRDVSGDPVDPNSDALIASVGGDKRVHPDFGPVWNGAPIGIPYVLVPGDQPRVPVAFEYKDESDPGPYPVPPDAPIEGGPQADGDRHVLVIDRDNWVLYDRFAAYPEDGGRRWRAGSGAIFDLKKPSAGQRLEGWTSADAAGLPVFPGLVRYEEAVVRKEIPHALRFTVRRTRRAYVPPATHYASPHRDACLPPMGMRVRLRANYDVARFPPAAQVVLRAMKKHGMILADNGGDWFVSGAPDPRWDDDELSTLKRVTSEAFEVVRMGEVTTG